MESSEFEETSRDMFSTSAYLIFTIDKLVCSIARQVKMIDFRLYWF